MHNSKASANNTGTTKYLANLLRRCTGGDIEIFGVTAKQQISYGTTDHKCVITGLLKAFACAQCRIRNITSIDTVLGLRVNSRLMIFGLFNAIGQRAAALGSTKYFLNEFFNHA